MHLPLMHLRWVRRCECGSFRQYPSNYVSNSVTADYAATQRAEDDATDSGTRSEHFGLPEKPLACGCSRTPAGQILGP
jgi:hypothetical protein